MPCDCDHELLFICTFVTCERLLNGQEAVLVPASTVLQWYCGGELSRRQEEALCSEDHIGSKVPYRDNTHNSAVPAESHHSMIQMSSVTMKGVWQQRNF